ncbi:hypothetical protein GM418_13875 [Maribellus comscasis]|uniref:Uncharacterized protein n=1 Tax=Maribellus comscasis TaxID=2681766 RepID=A0A6I6JP38_9BACT|nr:hypothetical protein [Maribellus comscasis]QGY44715.1 hypothetical protein GM418_13875 [Maribellus comscasis]
MNYWSFVRGFSILSFAVGLVLMVPSSFEKTNSKGKKSLFPGLSKIVAKLKPLILTILVFVVILGLERLGKNLNYRLRDYFLIHDTAIATGYAKGIKRIDLVKIGHEDFYQIDFNAGDKVQSSGLMVAYAAKDSGLFTEMNQYKNSGGQLIINNLRSGKVQVKYSKRFPSFFKVEK